MGDDSEWLKLPTDEKVQHKAWKARVAGYEECVKLFTTLGDEKSPEFKPYIGLIRKFVVDNNAIAQEKALDAVLAYVENAQIAGKAAGEVISGVVTKCLNSARTKTKEKGQEICLLYVEIEKQDVVQEELIKGLTNKQPKIVAGCIQTLRFALRDFGSKTMPIKPLVKFLQKLLEDRDKVVREETKQLIVEMYRWCGAAIKPQLTSLKPVQIQELEAEFENHVPGKAQQVRYLRSQQDLKEKAEAAAAAGDEGEEEEEEEAAAEVDPYELMEAVDILAKIPKDFYDKVEATKWQERKEALDNLLKLIEGSPKIDNGDFHDLAKALKKVVAKDKNIMIVTVAVKCIQGLSLGLRKKFGTYTNHLIDAVLEKFREKKATVVAVLREAVDAMFQTTNLDAISESCLEMLNHKTPSVRAETALFLSRSFTFCTTATLPKKLLKLFIAPLLHHVNDAQADVREASYAALGTAMKVVSEKGIMPFLADVDAIKMAKIKECYDKAELAGKAGKAKPAKEASAPEPSTSKKEAPKAVRGGGGGPPKAKESKGGASGGAPPGSAKPKAGAKPAAKKPAAKGKKGAGAASGKEEVMENALSDEAVDEKMLELIPGDVVPGLTNSNWKVRLASMEKFMETIKVLSKDEIPCQVCVRTITKKPGIKDNNFQVLKLRVEMLSYLATNAKFSKTSASFCLNELVEKVGDVKNGAAVQECFSCIAEACSLDYVTHQVISTAFEGKNPKNQSESLVWLARAIKEFGFKVNVKPLIGTLKKAFAHTNPAVRTAAVTLVGVVHMYMGPTARVFFEDEKPALLQTIDAEIEKVKGEKPPPPTRGLSPAEEGAGGDDDDDAEEGDDAADGPNIADLVPRNDISAQITEALVTEMADKNWKIRGEALQKLVTILNEAKFITPNIGPLPEALKVRLGDSNKILMTTTLGICTTISQAMGPNVKNHVRIIGPGIVSCLGDSKPMVRKAAVECLNAWFEQAGLVPFVEAEILSDELKKENPFLRQELLGWLAEKLPNLKKLPTELNLCTPYLYACLEDRNGDVRKRAQEAVLPFMIHLGFDSMAKAAGKLKATSKDAVIAQLEKARPNLPAKPVKAKKAAAPAPAKAASRPAPAAVIDDDESDSSPPSEEPAPESRPASAAPGKGRGKSALGKKAPPTSKKKDQEEDTTPPLKVTNGKEQRFKDEKNLKVLKWNFNQVRPEFIDQIRAQMENSFSPTLQEQLFHKDFKKQLAAIDIFIKLCDENIDALKANFDLILKWITLRFFDTNTTVLLKILDFLKTVFDVLADMGYHMPELEACAFVPYLINKVGDPKDNIRRDIRAIIKLVCKVYPASKLFSHLVDGLKSKNSKQRTECLEELGNLIENYGINVCHPSPAAALKLVAGQIGDRDNSVRSAALNTVVIAYCILGDAVYKYVGKLNDKEMDMLEERIKRSNKTRPAAPMQQVEQKLSPEPKAAPRINPQRQREDVPIVRGSRAKREFELEIEDEDNTNLNMPSLIEHDLDDVLNIPASLPKTRTRPPSPSMKLLSGSSDAKSAIDLVISQVASNDITTSIQALAQIDEVLNDNNKAELMTAHVDQLLVTCTLQLRMVYSKHMGDENTDKDKVVKLYRCILASLLALFGTKSLAKEASRDVLKDLLFTLISILLDTRLMDLDDGPQVVRSVNVVVVKIVGKADPTNIMSALIKLLHESVANETCSPKFLELVQKCLWKMLRMLPSIIDDLYIERTLADLHIFLKAFPSPTWKTRASDTPLRTVKTILHTLAMQRGNKIMSQLTLIDNPQESEVEAFLTRVIKNGSNSNNLSDLNTNGTEPNVQLRTPRKDQGPASASKRLSKTTHDMLAEIFKKIGVKENTREGLNDLYDFKQKYPEADLEPFLKKSSQIFQTYIERGLKNIESERQNMLKESNVNSMSSSGSAGSLSSISRPASGDHSDMNPQVYMDRLKELRARCGLDKYESAARAAQAAVKPSLEREDSKESSTESLPQLSTQLNSGSENQPPPPPSDSASTNLLDLKKRLERIKKTAIN